MKTTLGMIACALTFTSPATAQELPEQAKLEEAVSKRLAVMDADKDGKVTKAEYVAAMDKKFTASDTDHDGVMSQGEMMAIKLKEAKDMNAMKETK